MFDEFILHIENKCQVEIATEIRSINFYDSKSWDKISDIRQELRKNKFYDCLVPYVGYVACNIDHAVPEDIFHSFLSIARNVPKEKKHLLTPAIAEAYKKYNYITRLHREYFLVAGEYKLDIRPKFNSYFSERKINSADNELYSYAHYLALINDHRGIELFDQAARRTEHDPNELSAVLGGFEDVYDERLISIYERYANDRRGTLGPEGPETGGSPSVKARGILEYVYGRTYD